MEHKKVKFEGWKNCIEISSGKLKLVVATEIGPRIIGAFYDGSENLFCVFPETAGKTGIKEWTSFGGHRLWHAPEDKPRTYSVETTKVDVKDNGKTITLHKAADELSGIEKTIEITPVKNDSFKIVHKLRNCNRWDVELAPWAITVMAPGGTAVIPMPQAENKKGLLPTTFISLWPYTTLADGRIEIGSKYTLVKHKKIKKNAAKIGVNCEDAWIGYQNNGIVFIKKFEHFVDAEYPDNGCSVECYTCQSMTEIETLGPLYTLGYQEEISHTEIWSALKLKKEILDEKDAELVFG